MNQEKIGKFIARCRKEKNITQQELANRLQITDKAVSKWENGRCMPDISLITQLTKELDITFNELLSGEKLSNKEYKDKAEENLLSMINNSSFYLKERIEYFQKKWINEHCFELTIELIAIIICMIFGLIKNNGLQIISFIICIILLTLQYKRMINYIKKNTFKN